MAQTQDLYTYLYSYKSKLKGTQIDNFKYTTESTLQELFQYSQGLTTPETIHYWSTLFLIICEDKGPYASHYDYNTFNQTFQYALNNVHNIQDHALKQAYADCIDGLLSNEINYLDENNNTSAVVSLLETWLPYEKRFGEFDYTYKKFVDIAVASWWDKIREFNEGDHPGDDLVNVVHQLYVVQNAGIDIEDYADIFADSVFEYIDFINQNKLDNPNAGHNNQIIQKSHKLLNEFALCKTSSEVKTQIEEYRKKLNAIYVYVDPALNQAMAGLNIVPTVNFNTIDKNRVVINQPSKYSVPKTNIRISIHDGIFYDIENNHYVERKACIKIYSPNNNNPLDLTRAYNEINIYEKLSELSSSNNCFLKYYGSFYENGSIHMIMEWYDYNLMDYIYMLQQQNYVFQEPQYLNIIYKILDSFTVMAAKGILHNDIKPHNLLNDGNWNIKIIDFDVSIVKIQDTSLSMTGIFKIQGTTGYFSPEQKLALNSGSNSASFNREKSDVFSLGLVFYQLLFYTNVENLAVSTLHSNIDRLTNFSPETKRFLKSMLTENHMNRPLFREAMNLLKVHPITRSLTSDSS